MSDLDADLYGGMYFMVATVADLTVIHRSLR